MNKVSELRAEELKDAVIERMRSIGVRDPLWEMWREQLKRSVSYEADALCSPVLSDSLAHFNRGRMSMAHDLLGVLEEMHFRASETG